MSKTLKELVALQNLSGKTDSEIIIEWLISNDLAKEGIKLISKLADEQITKLEDKHNLMVSKITTYGGGSYLAQYYGIDIASKLDYIIINFICGYMPTENDMKWLRDTIPTLDKPLIFWRDFRDFLDKNKIFFKGEKK